MASRAPAIFTYRIVQLPPFDPIFPRNAANADFTGKSPGMVMVTIAPGIDVPMREFVEGDQIKFNLSALQQIDGSFPEVKWFCKPRTANVSAGRIFMEKAGVTTTVPNETLLADGDTLVLKAGPNGAEQWGFWAEIKVQSGVNTFVYTTADPEGVIGN